MAQPTPYTRSYSFTDYQTSNPSLPLPGNKVDEQLNAVAQSIGQVCDNLELIQRDDGELANQSVHKDAFDADARALIVAGGTPRGAWAASTAYAVKDLVSYQNKTWICHTAHTSSSSFDDTKFMLFSNGADLADTAFIQRFSGNGTLTSFTLSQAFGTDEKAVEVYVLSGTYFGRLDPVSQYTLNGTNLTTTTAVPSGTNNMLVLAPSTALQTAVANASLYATAAGTSATAAGTYATAAGTYATAAGTSATAAGTSATAAAASASSAAASAAAAATTLASALWRGIKRLTSADSPFTVTSAYNGTLLLCDTTSGSITINLPQISGLTLPFNLGVQYDAGGNTVVINRAGTDTIDGATSKTLSIANFGCELLADSTPSPDEWEVLNFGGESLTEGAGIDITSNTIKVDPSGLSTVTPATGDKILIGDVSDSDNIKVILVSALLALAGSDPTVSAQTGDFTAGSATSHTLYPVTPSGSAAIATLPAASDVAVGFRIRVKNSTDGKNVTIARAGSDTIDGATSFRVPGREEVEVTKTAAATWEVTKRPAHMVGQVVEFTGTILPDGGWLWPNGTAVSRTNYSGLLAVTGTIYGNGDGSTTFNVRDDRGRVKAAKDDLGGITAASRLTNGTAGFAGTLLGGAGGDERMHQHNHSYNVVTITGGSVYDALGTQQVTSTGSTTGNSGGGSSQNVQPTIISNFILKT